jgi:hypothetical protein
MDSAKASSPNSQLLGEFEVSGDVRASRNPVKPMESVASFLGKDGGELGASYDSPVHESGDISKYNPLFESPPILTI